jgi:hypothetical protein
MRLLFLDLSQPAVRSNRTAGAARKGTRVALLRVRSDGSRRDHTRRRPRFITFVEGAMTKSAHHLKVGVAALVIGAIVGALTVGCSTLPTAPTSDANRGAGTYTMDGGATFSPPTVQEDQPQPLTASKTMNGLLGGTVRAGKFTAVLPPGCFLGTRTVTVTQADPAKLQVELSMSGAHIQRFLTPIVLVADASDMQVKLLSQSTIAWLNPATGKWEPVLGCQVNLLGLSLSAPLWHFSTYSVQSKAGW